MPHTNQYRSAENRFRRFFAVLGPGLITGAADDDPSAIGTYSVVGARCGTTFLWAAFISWPLIAVIQMMCARIGLITAGGLARALGEKLPRPFVATVSLDCWSRIPSQSAPISPPWQTRRKCSAA